MAILITSIAQKVPLIHAVRAAATKIVDDHTIIGCDCYSDCLGKYFVDQFWHCPRLEDLAINKLLSFCKKNSITTLIPTRNADVDFYSHHRQTLEKEGIHPMV